MGKNFLGAVQIIFILLLTEPSIVLFYFSFYSAWNDVNINHCCDDSGFNLQRRILLAFCALGLALGLN